MTSHATTAQALSASGGKIISYSWLYRRAFSSLFRTGM